MSAPNPANSTDPDPLNPPGNPVAAAATPTADTVATQAVAAALAQTRLLPTGPLFFWVLVQVGALALAASRVPLAARYPSTGERYALDVVLAAQAGFAALLFPWLLRDLVAASLAAASCWPVLALAVMLAALKPSAVLMAGGYMTLWLAVLTAWRRALASEKSQMIGTAVAASWAIGGPIVWYLRAEFNSPMQTSPSPGPLFGPLTGALFQVEGSAMAWRPGDWLVLAALFFLGLVAGWIVKKMGARRR